MFLLCVCFVVKYCLADNVLTKEKKDFIDEQVDKFIGLTKRSQGVKKNGRQKRSFPIEDLETLSKDKYGK